MDKPEHKLKIHSDTAWNIASNYSYTLASDTRTLAAQIDVVITDKDRTIKELIEAFSDFNLHFSDFVNSSFDPWQVSKWDNEVWEARKRMAKSFDAFKDAIAKAKGQIDET